MRACELEQEQGICAASCRNGGFKTSSTTITQKTHGRPRPFSLPTGPAKGQRPPAPLQSHFLSFQASKPRCSSPSVSLMEVVLITGIPCWLWVPSANRHGQHPALHSAIDSENHGDTRVSQSVVCVEVSKLKRSPLAPCAAATYWSLRC